MPVEFFVLLGAVSLAGVAGGLVGGLVVAVILKLRA